MNDIEDGDRVLFNDRKQPLTVVDSGAEKLLVEGPNGGEYVVFPAPDDPDVLLVAKPGNRQYASKVEELRTVGYWEREDQNRWRHTGTGATVEVVENSAGNWTLDVDGIEPPELPGYGFLAEEDAVAAAEKFIQDNPDP